MDGASEFRVLFQIVAPSVLPALAALTLFAFVYHWNSYLWPLTVLQGNADQYPIDPTYYQAEVALGEHGRYGQKSGKGFYKYEKGDRKRYDDPEAIEIIKKRAAELMIKKP